MNGQPFYRLDCPDCHGTGRVYIGHPGRVAWFLCFKCTGAPEAKGADEAKTHTTPANKA